MRIVFNVAYGSNFQQGEEFDNYDDALDFYDKLSSAQIWQVDVFESEGSYYEPPSCDIGWETLVIEK